METAATASFLALAGRVAEEHHHAVADELVDGAAVLEGDLRHFIEVVVEQVGQGFCFQLFGELGEALDVGEEHRQSLALGFQANAALAGEDRFPDLWRQILGQVAGQARGLGLFQFDFLARQGQAHALLVNEIGGGADVECREQNADQRDQRRGDALVMQTHHGVSQADADAHAEQRHGQVAQAAAHQGAEAEGQQEHQAGHDGEAEQQDAGTGIHGVQAEQDLCRAFRMIALEAVAQVIGQVRIEQGVRHHPQQVHREVLDVGTGGNGRGADQIGEHAGVVLAQRASGEAIAALNPGGSHYAYDPW